MRLMLGLLVTALLGSMPSALAESDLLARTLSPEDRSRLERFDTVRAEAIGNARRASDAVTVAAVDDVLAGEPQPILGADIRGSYRCRVAKLSDTSPAVVYDWFQCAISEDNIGYRLEKTSGSQRLTGHFVDDSEKALVFYGASHYGYEQPRAYGDPEHNVVGRFVTVGEGRYRLEVPLPQRESTFDILELRSD